MPDFCGSLRWFIKASSVEIFRFVYMPILLALSLYNSVDRQYRMTYKVTGLTVIDFLTTKFLDTTSQNNKFCSLLNWLSCCLLKRRHWLLRSFLVSRKMRLPKRWTISSGRWLICGAFFSHHIRLTPARVVGVMASRTCPIPPSSMRAPCPLCHARPCPAPSDEELVSSRSRRRARLALIWDYPP